MTEPAITEPLTFEHIHAPGSRLTVIGEDTPGNRGQKRLVCRCECGTIKTFYQYNLRNGTTRSCGCLRSETVRARETIHGRSHTPAYEVFKLMHRRCGDPKAVGYHNYGGRGITVCERWKTFENFHADMGDPPPKLTLDRINNDGNYEPGNCQWATRSEQRRNQRPKSLWS